jgi:FKBP-type peptidyl-prolyl cis-trans isomerase
MARVFLPFLFMLLSACEPPVQEHHSTGPDPVEEQFVKANQYMQRRHQDQISAFVERAGWNARSTPSGLWIVIEDPGSGPAVTRGSRVTYAFTSTLLDGTPCYEASEKEPKTIRMGRGGVESGVEEGLQLLRQGSRAILLIPPHLAHGNFGDRGRIPGNSVLIYRIRVMDVR